MVGGSGKSDSIIAHIELSVIRSNEYIPKDPDGSHGRWNVQAHESRQTNLLAHLRNLHDVMLRLERKVNSSNLEINLGEVWKSGAI